MRYHVAVPDACRIKSYPTVRNKTPAYYVFVLHVCAWRPAVFACGFVMPLAYPHQEFLLLKTFKLFRASLALCPCSQLEMFQPGTNISHFALIGMVVALGRAVEFPRRHTEVGTVELVAAQEAALLASD